MFQVIKGWYFKYFSDPEAVLLFIVLLISFTLLVTIGDILAPVLTSVVIAYILEWWASSLMKLKLSRNLSITIVFISFLAVLFITFFLVFPILWKQFITLFTDMPMLIQKSQKLMFNIVEKFPDIISKTLLEEYISNLSSELQTWGKYVLSISVSIIPGFIAWSLYLVLVPFMVFFFLKDKELIQNWFSNFLPSKRMLLGKIWDEMHEQIGNYIRGKVAEIFIVGFVTYFMFLYLGLKYSLVLAVMVGLSVIVPYVGAFIVTIPVLVVGFIQWGWTADYGYLVASYLVIQILDGNVLVPILFSEAVNLHPIAIIVAVIIFGAFWGVWGIFFAIPLATLVKAVLNSWPNKQYF